VIALKVPAVDTDGNELGGVPVVLRDAPLGTYLGWNITAAGFHKGQICSFTGGMIPFASTRAQRLSNDDPRPSLEARYASRDAWAARLTEAVDRLVADRLLLAEDGDRLTAAAPESWDVYQEL